MRLGASDFIAKSFPIKEIELKATKSVTTSIAGGLRKAPKRGLLV